MIRIQDLGAKRFLRELVASVNDDNVFNGAAALGFFLTMAIFPGLIVLMSVIPYLPIPDIDSTIMDLLRQALPSEAAVLLQDVVTEVTQQQRGGALSFGLLATLWVASSGVYAIMQQLNITYGVKEARSSMSPGLAAPCGCRFRTSAKSRSPSPTRRSGRCRSRRVMMVWRSTSAPSSGGRWRSPSPPVSGRSTPSPMAIKTAALMLVNFFYSHRGGGDGPMFPPEVDTMVSPFKVWRV